MSLGNGRLCQGSRRQTLLRQQQGRMVPAPPISIMSLPRLWQVRVQKLAPAILRPTRPVTRAPCSARQLLSQAAAAVNIIKLHELIQITVRVI